jgi:hypothetical protein
MAAVAQGHTPVAVIAGVVAPVQYPEGVLHPVTSPHLFLSVSGVQSKSLWHAHCTWGKQQQAQRNTSVSTALFWKQMQAFGCANLGLACLLTANTHWMTPSWTDCKPTIQERRFQPQQ